MNILADECIDQQIVKRLRFEGYNVLYVAEFDPGIPDNVVLSPEQKADIVAEVFQHHAQGLQHNFSAVSPGMVRIRSQEKGYTAQRISQNNTGTNHRCHRLNRLSHLRHLSHL